MQRTTAALAFLTLAAPICNCGDREAGGSAQDPAPGSPPFAASAFTRFVPIGADEGRFDTAITTYRNADGAEVSLVAAVHIADAAHYAKLQQEFENYDVLLYELVAESDQRPTPQTARERSSGLIAMLQVALKQGLELEFQLHAIDYTKDNFVHADLTPAAFKKKMEERGETFVTMFAKLMLKEMAALQRQREEEDAEGGAAPAGEGEVDLVRAFRSGYGRHAMRMMFAQQLERIEALAAGAEPGGGTVLLEGRNERAVEVVRAQVADGKRRLGVYYGAAHMPGIERTLVQELGFRKTGERWLAAWDIRKRPDASPKPNK